MKQTNHFRKCPYCPHHQAQTKCCCRKTVTSRPKNKSKPQKKPQSALSHPNTTLPISVSNFEAMPSIMAENSILRTQNDYLKRELNTHYHSNYSSVQHQTNKDSPITTVYPNSQNDSSRTQYLQDKLYLSNKKLQQVLMELDYLSKINKSLNELNNKLQMEAEQLKIENAEKYEEVEKLMKKNKKMNKAMEQYPSQRELESLFKFKETLERDNLALKEENDDLKEIQRKLRSQISILENKFYERTEGLSPQWVAHTSTKINALEKNISKLEEDNREDKSVILFDNKPCNPNNSENILQIKNQLISAIKTLKTQSQAFQYSRVLDDLLCVDYAPLISLVKSLCEAFIEPIMNQFKVIEKQIQRKMKGHELKFQKLIQRMHNMVIKIHNDRIKARSFRRDIGY